MLLDLGFFAADGFCHRVRRGGRFYSGVGFPFRRFDLLLPLLYSLVYRLYLVFGSRGLFSQRV